MSAVTARGRKVTIISASVLIAFCIYILAFLVPDVIRTLGGPSEMTLADAASLVEPDDEFVSLSGYRLDCDSIRYTVGRDANNRTRTTTRATNIVAESTDGSVLMKARLSGRLECEEIDTSVMSGYLSSLSIVDIRKLTATYPQAQTFLLLCAYCGPENSKLGIIISSAMLLIGVALLVFGLKMKIPVQAH